ncbi:tol-pal system protein YbgF [Oryzomonas japonica]|uniref:Tol-pal system protein YbgF n=1 Tax=Oryzomonas japonica TaxID=2603858 RepID=A0A7J4ZUP0_9BACT|nr:tol-pal system protein YbgF [Oryzomonas japonica]KAB0667346.1 tol-pal system protein YbgF [Oryzomonas japonica]
MPSGIRWAVCVAASLALAGCASNDLMVKRQTETEAKVEHLIQSDKRAEQRMNELSGQVQSQEDQAKAVSAQLTQLQDTIRELRTAQDELKARISLQAAPKIEVINQEAASKGKDYGPPSDYVQAFGLYSANSFPAAIEAFEAFLKNNPKSSYAANAVYWIGECHYSLSALPKARDAFQKVVDDYPKSAKAPDALLKLGYTLAAMGEKDKATAAYERLIKAYPGSPVAAKARERLTAH